MHDRDSQTSIHIAEMPGALSYEAACHNWRQLISNHLLVLRRHDGAPTEGKHLAIGTIHPGTPQAARIEIASQHAGRARIAITPSAADATGNYMTYWFDEQAQKVSAQEFSADHQPVSEPIVLGDNASGEVALSALHTTLFTFNNSTTTAGA